jgi:hypothetical protein
MRRTIRDNLKAKLQQMYARKTGGVDQRIRKFTSGQFVPSNQLPSLTVCGGAQSRSRNGQDTETEKTLSYDVEIVLELNENWDNGEQYDEWETFVQDMIERLQNWLPCPGALRFDYDGDENPDEQMTFGPGLTIWVIRFHCDYFVEVGIIGRQD